MNPQNPIEIDKLFVLGAGASYSATLPERAPGAGLTPSQAPLDRDFTSVLWNMKDDRVPWVGKSSGVVRQNWLDHLEFRKLGLEDAIRAQAANTEFLNRIVSSVTIPFEEYLNYIVHLAAFRLKKAQQSNRKDRPVGKHFVYEEFANKHFIKAGENNRIITFNYDDLLDNPLIDAFDHKRVYSSMVLGGPGDSPAVWGGENPLMLKLHGSANWNCASDEYLDVVRGKGTDIQKIWYREQGCPSINDHFSPCMIPPIEAKPITSLALFKNLWSKSREYLSNCRELYICGYSLPPADALASALFKNFSNDHLERVIVVDTDASIMTRWRELLVRNKDSRVRVRKAEWSYHSDFGEFVYEI